jgi:anthranilate phosphoribosyltransferase
VAKHGNKAITSSAGSADILEELGVKLCKSPVLAAKSLHEAGICFMFAPFFHPAMKRVAGIRREIKTRTIFNMLGPLTNPAGAQYQVIGVFSPNITEKIARSLGVLGTRGAWVVHSRDGLDELSALAANRISEVSGGKVQTFELHPEYLEGSLPPGGPPPENASLVRSVLEGREKGEASEMVVLNAAAAIHLAGGKDMKEALEIARESIRSGEAERKLEILREISNSEQDS